ncbi:MAG: hypothetical protein P8Y38_11035, partial [Deltaproteobacteria bacterium]
PPVSANSHTAGSLLPVGFYRISEHCLEQCSTALLRLVPISNFPQILYSLQYILFGPRAFAVVAPVRDVGYSSAASFSMAAGIVFHHRRRAALYFCFSHRCCRVRPGHDSEILGLHAA